jgi:4-hydroxybenzoyl-CoA thioesterase
MPDPRTAAQVTRRVSIANVDHAQIFYVTYFLWMQDGYEELVRLLGHPIELHRREGVVTPIAQAGCEFVRPVVLGEEVQSLSQITRCGRSSFDVRHEFRRDGEVVAFGSITHVCVDNNSVPVSAPDWIRNSVTQNHAG